MSCIRLLTNSRCNVFLNSSIRLNSQLGAASFIYSRFSRHDSRWLMRVSPTFNRSILRWRSLVESHFCNQPTGARCISLRSASLAPAGRDRSARFSFSGVAGERTSERTSKWANKPKETGSHGNRCVSIESIFKFTECSKNATHFFHNAKSHHLFYLNTSIEIKKITRLYLTVRS